MADNMGVKEGDVIYNRFDILQNLVVLVDSYNIDKHHPQPQNYEYLKNTEIYGDS